MKSERAWLPAIRARAGEAMTAMQALGQRELEESEERFVCHAFSSVGMALSRLMAGVGSAKSISIVETS